MQDATPLPADQGNTFPIRGTPGPCTWPCKWKGMNRYSCNKCKNEDSVHHLCGIAYLGEQQEAIEEATGAHVSKWCFTCFSVSKTKKTMLGLFTKKHLVMVIHLMPY